MPSLRVVGGTAYILASVLFLYWRVQVTLHDTKCPRSSFFSESLRDTSSQDIQQEKEHSLLSGPSPKIQEESHLPSTQDASSSLLPILESSAGCRAAADLLASQEGGSEARDLTPKLCTAETGHRPTDSGEPVLSKDVPEVSVLPGQATREATDSHQRSDDQLGSVQNLLEQVYTESQVEEASPDAEVSASASLYPEMSDKPYHTTQTEPADRASSNEDQGKLEGKGDWLLDALSAWDPFGTRWLMRILEQSAEAIESALQESSDPAGLGNIENPYYSALSLPSSASSLSGSISSSPQKKSTDESLDQDGGLLSSPLTVLSLLNTMAILAFLLKEACLGTLSFMEAHRLVEMGLGYVFVKLIFFVIVLDSIHVDGAEWLLLWVCFFGVLKVLGRLARERFQRLTASPSATVTHHARTLSLLVIVLAVDVLTCSLALPHFPALDIPKFLLLAYEPASVALETTQTLVRYAFHLAEEFPQILAAAGKFAPFTVFLSSGASGAEWRASVLHHSNALFEVTCTLLTLAHCIHLWQLHSFSFHIIDIVLFLNARSLMGKLVKRARSFLRWRSTLKNLQSALPDASVDDITSFADDCAICKESMTSAKRLPCGHLFHLSCLRSWLDQGSAASHSCPSCRRPLRPGAQALPSAPLPATAGPNAEDGDALHGQEAAVGAAAVPDGALEGAEGRAGVAWLLHQVAQWAMQLQARLEASVEARAEARLAGPQVAGAAQHAGPGGPGLGGPAGGAPPGPGQANAGEETMRNGGFALWGHGGSLRFRGARGGGDAAGPATQNLPARVGRLWGIGSRTSRAQESPEELESRLVAMAAQVEEILPHVPFNTILQDLRRTRSVMITVNNLMDSW